MLTVDGGSRGGIGVPDGPDPDGSRPDGRRSVLADVAGPAPTGSFPTVSGTESWTSAETPDPTDNGSRATRRIVGRLLAGAAALSMAFIVLPVGRPDLGIDTSGSDAVTATAEEGTDPQPEVGESVDDAAVASGSPDPLGLTGATAPPPPDPVLEVDVMSLAGQIDVGDDVPAEEGEWVEPEVEPETEWVDGGNGVALPDVLLRIRFCESTNNYGAANRGSSARGAYQFLTMSWEWYGHAERYGVAAANLATPAQQDEAALLTFGQDGARPWAESRDCWANPDIDPRYLTARPPATTTTTSAPTSTTTEGPGTTAAPSTTAPSTTAAPTTTTTSESTSTSTESTTTTTTTTSTGG